MFLVIYNNRTGVPDSILGPSGFIPIDVGNSDFQTFLTWNAAQPVPLDYTTPISPTARKPRTLLAIRNDISNLTGTQKTNIWNNFISGSPPLWATDAGPNAAALAVLQLMGASVTLSAADVLEAKIRAVAMYCQDNPNYLVTPSFDNTINVPGDQLA